MDALEVAEGTGCLDCRRGGVVDFVLDEVGLCSEALMGWLNISL